MLKARFLTAIVLAPLALVVLFLFPKDWFLLVIDGVLLLGAWEWSRLSGLKGVKDKAFFIVTVALALVLLHQFEAVLPVTALLTAGLLFWVLALVWVIRYPSTSGWAPVGVRVLMGYAVLLPVWIAFGELKSWGLSTELILMLLLLVWAADVGAYFTGKSLGKNKLAPSVSPGKTREGLYGGLLSCVLVGLGFSFWFELDVQSLVYLVLLSVVTGMISVLGDLFESMLKRHQGMKDSSQLLPGHGGILDRMDSLTAAAPLFVLGVQFVTLN
ncbi:phosphatidate cytidylyltransferase [Pontibacterium granulatum]|uniref:phosphatidate cytidylyltransferase n=1 Tax=Pontibacterium granulatum TaxID=2036029 RepID=UPI00249B8E0F|nr:phosphatidate cytidylyltransferase [Pontibacterium granulatum]MDI3322961.1 phosphatidate cytidylyltransferase [Pontibacterium granulatum]